MKRAIEGIAIVFLAAVAGLAVAGLDQLMRLGIISLGSCV